MFWESLPIILLASFEVFSIKRHVLLFQNILGYKKRGAKEETEVKFEHCMKGINKLSKGIWEIFKFWYFLFLWFKKKDIEKCKQRWKREKLVANFCLFPKDSGEKKKIFVFILIFKSTWTQKNVQILQFLWSQASNIA